MTFPDFVLRGISGVSTKGDIFPDLTAGGIFFAGRAVFCGSSDSGTGQEKKGPGDQEDSFRHAEPSHSDFIISDTPGTVNTE
jgi:hypothetical protein